MAATALPTVFDFAKHKCDFPRAGRTSVCMCRFKKPPSFLVLISDDDVAASSRRSPSDLLSFSLTAPVKETAREGREREREEKKAFEDEKKKNHANVNGKNNESCFHPFSSFFFAAGRSFYVT